jgi:hypothetical protein
MRVAGGTRDTSDDPAASAPNLAEPKRGLTNLPRRLTRREVKTELRPKV